LLARRGDPLTFDVSVAPSAGPVFSALPFDERERTRETLHRYVQIVGKVRLGCCTPLNHWWNVTSHVSSRGLSTGPTPYGGLTFEAASWTLQGGTALVMCDDLRTMGSSETALLEFMESAYRAGAKTAGRDIEEFLTGFAL
jgi:Family of unknown function (DUF5996)